MAGYKTRNAWSAPDSGWPSFKKDGLTFSMAPEQCPGCGEVLMPRLHGYCDVCGLWADEFKGEKA